MVQCTPFILASAAFLAAAPAYAGLYSKSSPVVQIDGKSYERLIAQSNYTSIVEFYAPWCGHCKNLQPAYEKAAKSLSGLAKVAAIDCDDESNKPFCGRMGIQGFPTLKIVKPGSKPGKPIVEDYQGPRTAKDIVVAVTTNIPNLVKKVDDKTVDTWLKNADSTAKAILFSAKDKVGALLKAVAIEFKGSIEIAQVKNSGAGKKCIELFGITEFPALLLLPRGSDAKSILYDGTFDKENMVRFLSQVAIPNPDPAPAKARTSTAKDDKAKKEKFKSASQKLAKSEASTVRATASEETLEAESPEPIMETAKPVVLPVPAPPIPAFTDEGEFFAQCFNTKTGICVLVLLPEPSTEIAYLAVDLLADLAHRQHIQAQVTLPFYILPEGNKGYQTIKSTLDLEDFEIIAINAKRGWWSRLLAGEIGYEHASIKQETMKQWIESLRLGDAARQKFPDSLSPKDIPNDSASDGPSVDQTVVEEIHDEL